jgi:Schlafen, AlbA_2
MARSVSELLPRRFADLTLDDVAAIIQTIGEERETLFFERKASVNGNALAKACSAFANTYGGLLVVGVADDDDTLVGIEPLATEAQLWVKDTLRGLVLPMPPFRGRWLPTDGDRGLLLVLVEESATTPHLLTRSGAIYVRNPGSSDPVPIADQRRLLDLAGRGERAIAEAQASAHAALDLHPLERAFLFHADWEPTETLVVAPAGISVDFEERLFDAQTPDMLSRTKWGALENRESEGRRSVWGQHYVGAHRSKGTPLSHRYRAIEEAVLVTRAGAVAISRDYVWSTNDIRALGSLEDNELRSYFADALRVAREILVEYGCHGDLRLVYKLDPQERGVSFNSIPSLGSFDFEEPLIVELDTTFDDDTAEARVFAEVLRAAGVGPRAE